MCVSCNFKGRKTCLAIKHSHKNKLHADSHTRTHARAHACTHTYIPAHTHTHTHTHTFHSQITDNSKNKKNHLILIPYNNIRFIEVTRLHSNDQVCMGVWHCCPWKLIIHAHNKQKNRNVDLVVCCFVPVFLLCGRSGCL